MNYQVGQRGSIQWVELLPHQALITSENDALDWVGVCGELRALRLLVHESNLPEAFFDLRSGLAGGVLLKFSNYRMRVAAVVSAERANQGRFGEMVQETNRGSQFRVFQDATAAREWLAK